MTRSKIAGKILAETPQEIRDKVREYGNELVTNKQMIPEDVKKKIEELKAVLIKLTTGSQQASVHLSTSQSEIKELKEEVAFAIGYHVIPRYSILPSVQSTPVESRLAVLLPVYCRSIHTPLLLLKH